ADKAGLLSIIRNATALHDAAVGGSSPGQYPASAKTAFRSAIGAANAVYADGAATQQDISEAIAALQAAVLTFQQSVHVSTPVDYAQLQAAIEAAEAKLASATEGDKLGQYPKAAVDALAEAIEAAKAARNDG